MRGLFCIFSGLFGLVIGCLTNTIEYRMRSELGLFTSDCYCTSCRSRLKLTDQIPLIGYLRLGGKCRFCGQPISIRYPIIEIGTAAVYALLAFIFYPSALITSLTSFLAVALVIVISHGLHRRLGISKKRICGFIFLALLQLIVLCGLSIITL